MRTVTFTGYKPIISQPWLCNELDIFHKKNIKILLPYICRLRYREKKLVVKQYSKEFFYIPRLTLSTKRIIRVVKSQLVSFIYNPRKYAALLFLTLVKFNWSYIKNFIKLNQIIVKINRFNPDLIYSHAAYDQYILAFLASRFLNKRFGLISHSTYNYPPYVSYLHQQANFIVVKSKYLKNDYLKRYPQLNQDKISVLPWGIDTEFFRPFGSSTSGESSSATLEVSSGMFTILSISRFVKMKGLIYLLEACKLLANENIKFTCILVGYGQLKSSYQRFIDKNNLNDRVKIYPPIPHSLKLKKLLAVADVFVLPAVIDEKTGEQDFIPNAVLEAMAMEKVVITTKLTGMQEVARDGESIIFCQAKDPVDLAKKIRMVMELSKERRIEIGRKAREIVVEKYDKWKQGEKFVKFLKTIVQN